MGAPSGKRGRVRKRAMKTARRTRDLLEWFGDKFPAGEKESVLEKASGLEQAAEAEDADGKKLKNDCRALTKMVDQRLPFWFRTSTLETIFAFLIAFTLVILFRSFILQPYRIPSGSMAPGLVPGDRVLALKLPYGLIVPGTSWKIGGWRTPQRGEVLVFKYPKKPGLNYIKRLIAVPGDTVAVSDGRIVLNGQQIQRTPDGMYRQEVSENSPFIKFHRYEETLGSHSYATHYYADEPGKLREMKEITLPEGRYFFMGDNRDKSHDGRAWGLVDYSLIRGKALYIYLPGKSEDRWSRMGRKVE